MAGNPNNNKEITKQKVTHNEVPSNKVPRKSSKKKKKWKLSDYLLIVIAAAITGAIVLGVINANLPNHYFIRDIKVLECFVNQKIEEDGKYYIKVSPIEGIALSEDNSWVEVQSDFYYKIPLYAGKVGVEFANVDTYSTGLFSKGQTFEGNAWCIEEVFASIDEANKATPTKDFVQSASIQKKKITQKGDHFFVLTLDQKSMPVMVEEEIYNKYNINDSINCEFQSIGELTKFIKIAQ